MTRNLVSRRLGRVLLLRQNESNPEDQEWEECLALLEKRPSENRIPVCVLVLSDGGGPSPDQRKRLGLILKGVPARVAVCTDSVKTRFIVSSVALLTAKIRAFSPSEIQKAFEHLELSAQERELSATNLEEMTKEVNGIRYPLLRGPSKRR
jgi:hypothetical protein